MRKTNLCTQRVEWEIFEWKIGFMKHNIFGDEDFVCDQVHEFVTFDIKVTS